MFILSIVPIHLSTDSNTQSVDLSNSIDAAEHRIMALEALLSSLMLRQYLGVEVSGVDNTDINAVTQELQVAREALVQLMASGMDENSNDASKRLEELSRMSDWIDIRINDLQALYDSLSTSGTPIGYHVSGVINTDINMVKAELTRALAYKEMVQASNQYWNQVMETQTQAGLSSSSSSRSIQSTISPENATLLALTKSKIISLTNILGGFARKRITEEIVAEESRVMQEIRKEMSKAQTYLSGGSGGFTPDNNPSAVAVLGLRAQLKALVGEKSISIINASLKDSVSNLLQSEISYASSIA